MSKKTAKTTSDTDDAPNSGGEVKTVKKRPTPRAWKKAETMWASGTTNVVEICDMLGVTRQVVWQHMRDKGIKRGQNADIHAQKLKEELDKTLAEDASVAATRARETKEEHYKMASGLAKLAWTEILQAKANGTPLAAATNNLKAIDTAMNVLSKARVERWTILGLDKEKRGGEDILPELVVSELTAEQVDALRNKQFVGLDDDDEIAELEEFGAGVSSDPVGDDDGDDDIAEED